MRRKGGTWAWMMLALGLTALPATAQFDLKLSGPEKSVSVEISHPFTGKTLKLRSQNGATFFYETDNGKVYLSGAPDELVREKSVLFARWQNLGGRQVELRLLRDDADVALSLRAAPDADILQWGFEIVADTSEKFTGVMERVVDGPQKRSWKPGIDVAMDLRGQKVTTLVKPTLSLYSPFFLSTAAYGLWIESTWPVAIDFCRADSERVTIVAQGPALRARFLFGETLVDVVKKYNLLSGPPFLPPNWAFRPWRWRDEHKHLPRYFDGTPVKAPYNSQVVEDILMMQALDIPCGVYWVDRPWAKGSYGYDDFEFDTQRLPAPKKMIDWLHGKNIRFLLWIAPWVQGDMAAEARKRGFNYSRQNAHHTDRILIDFTNPQATRWWQETGLQKIIEAGVDGCKLDRSEELVPADRRFLVYNGKTMREVRNDYPRLYVKAAYEAFARARGQDFVLMPRAGYFGSSRYGVFWGGDIGGSEWGLRAAIIAALRSSLIGFPIWGSDTGGYWGGFDREVTARWLAFSCFTPIMEVGPTENRAFWDMPKKPHYDAELIAIWRLYAKLHDRLADYSYRAAKQAHEEGVPVVRPLLLLYPEKNEAWFDWATYLYGEDILVAAIWQKGQKSRLLYLPPGARWCDAWNPEDVYDGDTFLRLDTPLHKIPIFFREGSGVDLGDLNALYRESLELAKKKPSMARLQTQETW
ncbi:MAG: glycoside hydrolase family 31 protein [candidate division KSB1 bacterium]|nr:glycoside hydrolase family 31 protein [candidate division KSB1 bacterium]